MTQTHSMPKRILLLLIAGALAFMLVPVFNVQAGSNIVQPLAPSHPTTTLAAKAPVFDTSLGGLLVTIAPMHKTSKRINVANSSKSNNAKIYLYSNDITPAQRFKLVATTSGYYRIVNVWSGKALSVNVNKAKANAPIVQKTVSSAKAQQWRFAKQTDGSYRLLSRLSAKYELSVAGSKKTNGTALVLGKVSTTAKAHRFKLAKITPLLSSGVYEVKSALSSRSLDIAKAAKTNNAQIEVKTDSDTLSQRWQMIYSAKNGYYTLKSDLSGKRLNVKANVNSNNTKVQQYTAKTTPGQLWAMVSVGGGKYALRSATGGKALTVKGSSKSNGADVVIYKYAKSTVAQQWTFASSSTIVDMPLTLEKMASLQKGTYVSEKKALAGLDPAKIGATSTQFADLRGSGGLTATQLNAYIASTANGKKGVLYKKGAAFKAAADKYNINEAYLLGHAILESGWGTSTLAKGQKVDKTVIGGKTYPAGTYYNLFGWGAFDSSPVSSGLTYAIKNGWSSVDKAISGAAQVISANYINAGSYPQYTLYGMRWHYTKTAATGKKSDHQYATATDWAKNNAALVDEIYAKAKSIHALRYEVVRYAQN